MKIVEVGQIWKTIAGEHWCVQNINKSLNRADLFLCSEPMILGNMALNFDSTPFYQNSWIYVKTICQKCKK